MSQKPEGSNRTAEGQGQTLHSVPELDTSLKPGEQWEEELWDSVVPTWPLSGQQREGALGDTEMQDRLHILEDLNMLYIRQMALSLEVMPRPLDNVLPVLSQP